MKLIAYIVILQFYVIFNNSSILFPNLANTTVYNPKNDLIPNIVHQIYDYQSPNFFLYLSIMCVQRFIQPRKHILWVNDEGRYRKGHWHSWQQRANEDNNRYTWEFNMSQLIRTKKLIIKFLTFPISPPGNDTIYAPNKAHRSDFVRMSALESMGGMYLDTDAFPIQSMDSLRQINNFIMSFDNIVNIDKNAPKRLNNGVLLSSPHALFLKLWIKKYANFNPNSFDYDSSVVPYDLMTQYPDLIHIEMSRISPMSYAFQTSKIAEAITCGIFVPPYNITSNHNNKNINNNNNNNNNNNDINNTNNNEMNNIIKASIISKNGAIWIPSWTVKGGYSYENTLPDEYMYLEMQKKIVLHLTMSQVRGICMMRKNLGDPNDLSYMPSFLGRIFRIALYGIDNYNYNKLIYQSNHQDQLKTWQTCRDHLGMYMTPDNSDISRQQYINMK